MSKMLQLIGKVIPNNNNYVWHLHSLSVDESQSYM